MKQDLPAPLSAPKDPAQSAEQNPVTKKSELSSLARAWMFGALAMELTFGVVGGGLLGYALDRWFETNPLWTVLCLILGCTSGLILLIRGLKRLERPETWSERRCRHYGASNGRQQ